MTRKEGIFGRLALGLSAAALAGALALAPALSAQPPGRGGGRMGGMLRHALGALDLSQDQKDKIHEILQAEKPALQSLREQMRTDRRALRDAADSNADAATVGNAFLKLRSDRQAMRAERDKVKTQIETLLTPEQKAKFEGFLAAARFHRGMRGPNAGN